MKWAIQKGRKCNTETKYSGFIPKKKGIYRVKSDLASCLRANGYKASERVSSFVSAPGDFTAM